MTEHLDEKFVAHPPLSLSKVVLMFRDSSPLSPLIFKITPGIDPRDEIMSVTGSIDLEEFLKSYSLDRVRGQGADYSSEEIIELAAQRGTWG